MSKSELHDWECDIEELSGDNADKMLDIAKDIYKTAFVRGRNSMTWEQQPNEDAISRQAMLEYKEMNKTIENIDDVKRLIADYEQLKDSVIELLDYDGNIDNIIDIGCCDDKLEISFTTYDYCYGEYFTNYYDSTIPIAWLFLDAEALEKAKKEKKEAEEEAKRKLEEKNEIFRKKEQERKDREEYERLKKKFEGEE